MSSQLALVANEPVRAQTERVRRNETAVDNSSASSVVTVNTSTNNVNDATDAKPMPADVKAPDLETAVDAVQTVVSDLKRELQFSVDEDSGRTIITVIDRESGKIIRQIPSEELLQIADRLAQSGDLNLIDSQA